MRQVVAIVLLLTTSLAAADPAPNTDLLVGSWSRVPKGPFVDSSTMRISKDGTFKLSLSVDGSTSTKSGTWTIAEGKLVIKLKGTDGADLEEALTIKNLTAQEMVLTPNSPKEKEPARDRKYSRVKAKKD